MMLTQNAKRRNVAYARYSRALVVLVLFPVTVQREVDSPSLVNAALVAAVTGLALLAGWMYREAVRWWTESERPDPTPPPPDVLNYRIG